MIKKVENLQCFSYIIASAKYYKKAASKQNKV